MHRFVVVDVDRNGDVFDDFEGVGESAFEGGDYDYGVDVALQLGKSLRQHLSG